jgi:hypothetical protein
MTKKLEEFLDERDGNWVIHLASWMQLEQFAIEVTDDHSAITDEYEKLKAIVLNELRTVAALDFNAANVKAPPPPPPPPVKVQPAQAH